MICLIYVTFSIQIETDLIHQEDIDIYVIAVGNNINRTQLENLNKQPRPFYSVQDFNAIDDVINELVVQAETGTLKAYFTLHIFRLNHCMLCCVLSFH